MIDWQSVQAEFRNWDGSFRDVYISPASLDDWRAIYPFLLGCPDAAFSVDGVSCMPPRTIEEAFVRDASPLLSLRAGRAQINFHFFTQDEIECDVDPRDVTSQADLDALLAFVRELGDRTHKTAVIAPENQPECAIISYDPRTKDFKYHSPSSA